MTKYRASDRGGSALGGIVHFLDEPPTMVVTMTICAHQ
jgi:hypothetical protein